MPSLVGPLAVAKTTDSVLTGTNRYLVLSSKTGIRNPVVAGISADQCVSSFCVRRLADEPSNGVLAQDG